MPSIIRIKSLNLTACLLAAVFALTLASPHAAMAQAVGESTQHANTAANPVASGNASVAPQQAKDTVENPYGLEALWKGGDAVSRGTLLILFFMSIGSWYLIAVKFFTQSKLRKHGQSIPDSFLTSSGIRKELDTLDKNSAYRFVAQKGLDATERHKVLGGHVDLSDWIALSIQRATDKVQSKMQDGLAFLATVGSVAPFVGLFGTVWGIYHALTAIGIAGQASIDKVAGPVGEALIMTAIGLGVAVPAVLGYNLLVRRNKIALEEVRAFGAELHVILLGTVVARVSNQVSFTNGDRSSAPRVANA